MFMVKFSPTALNFGYDFVLWVHFLGYPVYKEDNGGGWFHCERCCMSLLCRLICPLIHRCSSTSSVLTCPPPKDPLHTSCPAPPAPRRRPPASCPSFSNHPPSPPLSFVRRDLLYIFPPFFVTFIVPFDLFTRAFRRQGLRFYPRHPQPQAIIHILCRQV